MNPSFWQGKRVLVTGHTGFKGSWLALWLQRLGAEVTGLALAPPSEPSLFDEAGVGGGMRSILGDIRELETVLGAFASSRPQVVLHLAAQSLVPLGYRQPLETYSTNVMGTAHVLEACRRHDSVRAVVSVTSDKCYENREWVWGYREIDVLGGRDPYSSSKACAEIVTSAYRRSYFREDGAAAVASARSGNVIGGGDWAANRLVPDLIRGFQEKRPVLIRRPASTRPWQHVLEPLRGYLDLAECLWGGDARFATAFNFGPAAEDVRPVREIADRLVELWGEGAGWREDTEPHPPEARLLKLDCARATDLLGWRPLLPLERAIEWLVDWHRGRLSGGDPRRLTELQIERYEEQATGEQATRP